MATTEETLRVIVTVRHPALCRRVEVAPDLVEALAAEAEEPLSLVRVEDLGDGWSVEVHSDEADLVDVVAALDEVEVAGHRIRGRATLRGVDEDRGLEWAPDGSVLHADPARSVGAYLLRAVAPRASEGHLPVEDAAFAVDSGQLWIVVRRSLFRGPWPRAVGTRGAWARLGPWPCDVPPTALTVRLPCHTLTLGRHSAELPPPTVPALRHELAQLGVSAGDTVMVHASMRAVGAHTEELLQALEAAVGEGGTLLVLVAADPHQPFHDDVPAWSDLGVFAEAARTRAGWRSDGHPFARFVAWGAGAEQLLSHVPIDDYYGPGGVLERLVNRGGKVLRLGSDSNTTTLFHWAEYVAAIPNSRRVSYTVDVRTPAGVRPVTAHCLDDSHGIFDWDEGDDYFDAILAHVRATPACVAGRVGRCDAELLDAEGAVEGAVAWLRRAFG